MELQDDVEEPESSGPDPLSPEPDGGVGAGVKAGVAGVGASVEVVDVIIVVGEVVVVVIVEKQPKICASVTSTKRSLSMPGMYHRSILKKTRLLKDRVTLFTVEDPVTVSKITHVTPLSLLPSNVQDEKG